MGDSESIWLCPRCTSANNNLAQIFSSCSHHKGAPTSPTGLSSLALTPRASRSNSDIVSSNPPRTPSVTLPRPISPMGPPITPARGHHHKSSSVSTLPDHTPKVFHKKSAQTVLRMSFSPMPQSPGFATPVRSDPESPAGSGLEGLETLRLSYAASAKQRQGFVPIYSTRLWDRPDAAFVRSRLPRTLGTNLENCLKELKKVESNYVEALKIVCEKYVMRAEEKEKNPKDTFSSFFGSKESETEGKTLVAGYNSFLTQTLATSEQYSKIIKTIDTILTQKSLTAQDRILLEPANRYQKEVQRAYEVLQSAELNRTNLQKKLDKFSSSIVKYAQSKFKGVGYENWRQYVPQKKGKRISRFRYQI